MLSLRTQALTLFVLVCTSLQHATTYTNKTFFSPRPSGTFLPLELPILENAPDAAFQIRLTPNGRISTNSSDLRDYFFFDCLPCLNVGQPNSYADRCINVDHRNLKFNETSSTILSGIISFKPRIDIAELRVDYYQSLDIIMPGLFFAATIPIIFIQQDLNMCVSCQEPNTVNGLYIENYFNGTPLITHCEMFHEAKTCVALQESLQALRISCANRKIGVADLYISLGYTVCDSQRLFLQSRLETIFPTSRTSTGDYLFEAREGHGGHWGIGLRADGLLKLWQSRHAMRHHLKLATMLRWNYLFSATETRTFGLRSTTGCPLPWAHYQLLGLLDAPLVIPAANILTQLVSVHPNNQGEILAALSYQYDSLVVRAGYDFWVWQGEKIRGKQAWCGSRYAFPASTYAAQLMTFPDDGALFTLAQANNDNTICLLEPASSNAAPIAASQIDCCPPRSPGTMTHTLFASAEFIWHWRHPITIGLGGAYEFTVDNAAGRFASLWLTGSFNF